MPTLVLLAILPFFCFVPPNCALELGSARRKDGLLPAKGQTVKKQTVYLGLVYQNYGHTKVYDKAFKESIRDINNGESITFIRHLASKYVLSPVHCVLPRGRFFPSDVLDCLCGVMVSNRVALIVFVTASEEFGESTAAAQYFLHMASQTGIPIVAWNSDNSGFTFSRPISHFRILQLAPPIQHQVRAMLSLLKRYQWVRFGAVTSKMAGSTEFLKTVQQQIQTQEHRAFRFEIVHQEEIDDELGEAHIAQRLANLKNSEARIILLYSTNDRARKMFEIAESMGLLGASYLWIGTQSVRGSMQSAVRPFPPGMLSVNFHTSSNAMFPPVDDVLPVAIGLAPKLLGLGLIRLTPNQTDQTIASTANCEADSISWTLGGRIYENMRNSIVKGNPYHLKDGMDSFFYRFSDQGTLRDSFLTISNLRRTDKQSASNLQWKRVGEFSGGQLRMADMEWPGGRTNPPQGTPDKYYLF